jgi:hypothetical protein
MNKWGPKPLISKNEILILILNMLIDLLIRKIYRKFMAAGFP